MKGIVAYDSEHGSTKMVAEAVAEQIRSEGHEAEIINVKEDRAAQPKGDFLFIGSPTRAGRRTGPTKRFLEDLKVADWNGKPVVVFDTWGPVANDAEKLRKYEERMKDDPKGAAPRLKEIAQERGLSVRPEMLRLNVTGMWGPLAADGPQRAKEFTRKFLASLK
ncbi:MAG: flavodoxin family protein [Methanomassiliicoccales archaeon]